MYNHIKIVATATGILAEETLGVGLVDGILKLNLLIPELTTHINVRSLSTHGKSNDKCSLNELVGVVSHNFSVFAGTGFRFVSINNQVRWPSVRHFGHERVLESTRETSATTAAQARFLDLVNNPVVSVGEDLLGLMPVSALHSAINPAVVIVV